jgi:hypothetical protein
MGMDDSRLDLYLPTHTSDRFVVAREQLLHRKSTAVMPPGSSDDTSVTAAPKLVALEDKSVAPGWYIVPAAVQSLLLFSHAADGKRCNEPLQGLPTTPSVHRSPRPRRLVRVKRGSEKSRGLQFSPRLSREKAGATGAHASSLYICSASAPSRMLQCYLFIFTVIIILLEQM